MSNSQPVDSCISCGVTIPEGRITCPACDMIASMRMSELYYPTRGVTRCARCGRALDAQSVKGVCAPCVGELTGAEGG